MKTSILGSLIAFGLLTACFKIPLVTTATAPDANVDFTAVDVKTTETETGGIAATIKAGATAQQLVKPSDTSSIAGSQVRFPPGSLSVDTTINMDESTSIATSGLTSELGITTNISGSGKAVAVTSSAPVDAAKPFVLSVPLPITAGLADTSADLYANLVVMYRVNIASSNKIVSGVIPRSQITIVGNVAEIESNYFGSFQAAFTSTLVADQIQVDSNANILTKSASEKLAAVSVTARRPMVVKADGTVELTGSNFRSTLLIALGGIKAKDIRIVSDTKATFVAPAGAKFGLADLALEQDGTLQTATMIYTGTKNDFPVMMRADTEVCAGEKFYNADGDLKTGTRDCGATAAQKPACTATLTSDCLLAPYAAATQPFKAVNVDALDANTIKTGATIAGVAGTYSANGPANCTADAQTNCVTIAAYPSVDLSALNGNKGKIINTVSIAGVTGTLQNCTAQTSNCYLPSYAATSQPLKAISFDSITAGIIKNGAVVAGITGTYPSASAPLMAADAYSDLDTTTFNSKMSNSAVFGWFDRNGMRYSHAGAADLVPSNLKATATIFGITGSFVEPAAWDVRSGTTVGSVVGKLKVDCKNRVSSTLGAWGAPKLFTVSSSTSVFTLTNHGFVNGDLVRAGIPQSPGFNIGDSGDLYVVSATANTLKLSTTSGGTAISITADGTIALAKYQAGLTTAVTSVDDYNNGGSFPTINPNSAANDCSGIDTTGVSTKVWKDVTPGGSCASGLDCIFKDQITNLQWSKVQSTGKVWLAAVGTCEALNYGGSTGWHLPSMNEVLGANAHGLLSAVSANWIPLSSFAATTFWTSTHSSTDPLSSYHMNFSSGSLASQEMSATHGVICVHQ